MFGELSSDEKYLLAASKFFDWFLTKSNPETGWVDNMGFYKGDHAARESLTHTMAYTYRGLLEYALLLKRTDLLELVHTASKQIIQRFNSSGFLSAVYDAEWNEIETYSCLTGNCQLSVVWLKLFKYFKDEYFLKAAQGAIEQVKCYQSHNSLSKGIRGGIAGSHPIWGGYITYGYPNWAAKFFVDALLLLEQADADSDSSKTDFGFFEKE